MHPLLLDFDGTLVDTRLDITEAVNRLLAELGLGRLPVDRVMGYVGQGARVLIRRSLDTADPEGRIPRDQAILGDFLSHYSQVLLDHTQPYPGVVDGLRQLQASSVPLAVVSNKPEAPLRTIVEGLGLASLLPVLVGGDTAEARKPDVAPLRLAAERLGVALDRCIFVGDSDVDIEAARNAGIPSVWCQWGGIHADRPTGPDHVASAFDEVVALALAT